MFIEASRRDGTNRVLVSGGMEVWRDGGQWVASRVASDVGWVGRPSRQSSVWRQLSAPKVGRSSRQAWPAVAMEYAMLWVGLLGGDVLLRRWCFVWGWMTLGEVVHQVAN